MNNSLRNILAIVAGAIIGSIINGCIVSISGSIIPPPGGVDLTTEAGLKAAMPLMEPRHFLMPWLAHALGTLVGATITVKIAKSHHLRLALVIGALFFAGGIMMVNMLPGTPLWFIVADLAGAYFPMGYLAARFFVKKD